MGKLKVSREELKHDELLDFSTSVMMWYHRRQNLVWTTAIALIAVFFLWNLWGHYSAKRKMESSQLYYKALEIYQGALNNPDAKSREQELKQSSEIADRVRNQFPGSEAAREALLLNGNALFSQNNPKQAIEKFEQFRSTASKPDDVARGLLNIGYCYENLYFLDPAADPVSAKSALDSYQQATDKAREGDLKRQAMLGQGANLRSYGKPAEGHSDL